MAEHHGNGNGSLKTYDDHVPEIKFTKLFINGEFVDSVKGRTFETIDPRNGEVTARVAEGDEEDVDLAVKAARQAFDHGPWPRMPGYVAPALAAGCTMVMKPAEQTPLSALFSAHLAKKAGVPNGVINVVTGFGPTAGAAISSHMDIDMVSFTGSTEVGRMVMQAAATSNLKQVLLELGGKSPLIVFDDADIDTATDLALACIVYNKGEVCVAGSRVYVQEAIYEVFEKKLVAKAKAWSVGDPFDPNVRQGPQVDKKQFEKILSYIEHGKREGAMLLTGGAPLGTKGYYIQPTIFTNVKEDNVIVKDEIFGPVMSLMKFKTVEEVIKRANDTRYGLAAGILTKNIDLANTVSRSIRAGIIWINCYFAFDNDCPYGGYKMSGFGRDFGLDALHKYLHVKSVVTPVYNSPWL
ncbi:aldehyde dehydrogenase family 2 member C4-like isoform X3 [Syzygium oleosum]|uniref:aldehyde dehydrogenase family 2 member C4-like isoform X3 n=1 Tax=Syzygium oleosum TaxID=219896 RepID=UPI0024BBD555|nr:aldehyde dehydrogenase family 2 member C4-like isoform X3 [Syzygium oleosum]